MWTFKAAFLLAAFHKTMKTYYFLLNQKYYFLFSPNFRRVLSREENLKTGWRRKNDFLLKKFVVLFRKEKLWDHNNRPFSNKISLLFTLLIMLQIALDGARSRLRSRINDDNNTSLVLWSLYIWVAPKWKHLKCQKPICGLVLDSFTIFLAFKQI